MTTLVRAVGMALGLALLASAWSLYRNPVMDLTLAANIFCQ